MPNIALSPLELERIQQAREAVRSQAASQPAVGWLLPIGIGVLAGMLLASLTRGGR